MAGLIETYLNRYNSAVFQTIGTTSYSATVIGEGFLHGRGWHKNAALFESDNNLIVSKQKSLLENLNQSPPVYDNLTSSECIRSYNKQFMTDRRDVYAVSQTDSGFNESLLVLYDRVLGMVPFNDDFKSSSRSSIIRGGGMGNKWLCQEQLQDCEAYLIGNNSISARTCTHREQCAPDDSGRERSVSCGLKNCDPSVELAKADDWAIGGYPISYCLSEKFPEQCELQFSVPILAIVIVCNIIKVVAMFLCSRLSKDEPLITVGDATASFLDIPDSTTAGLCMLSGKGFRRGKIANQGISPRFWRSKGHSWFSAASKVRWLLTVFA